MQTTRDGSGSKSFPGICAGGSQGSEAQQQYSSYSTMLVVIIREYRKTSRLLQGCPTIIERYVAQWGIAQAMCVNQSTITHKMITE